MARRLTVPWPTGPRTVFFDDVASRDTLSRAVADGRIRRLAPRLYSSDLSTDPAEIVDANRWPILGRLLPGAVIVDRSAARDGGVTGGCIFVAAETHRKSIRLPGMEIRIRPSEPLAGPVEDPAWASGLRMSSPARIVVDNLAVTRGRAGQVSRTLSLAELEDWLAGKAISWGPERMARLRDQAVLLADAMGHPDRAETIDRLFARLGGDEPARPTSGQLLVAYTSGRAWDGHRLELFNRLAQELANYEDSDVPGWLPARTDTVTLPFFESYFSNYIEGTVFSVSEARRIVDTRQPPADRPADGHDILGTYRCVADTVGRKSVASDADGFLGLLRERHRMILGGRPEMTPGEWKQKNNHVGAFVFVKPQLVEGTLRQGFELAPTVPAGLRRALFMMFLVAEVHPFTDGNGRVARVMMNAELSAVDAARIIIPAVYRNEYIGCLRRTSTTQADDVTALMRVMSFAWRWTAAMPWHDRGAADGQLEATNALRDPDDAALGGIKLRLP